MLSKSAEPVEALSERGSIFSDQVQSTITESDLSPPRTIFDCSRPPKGILCRIIADANLPIEPE